MSTSFPGSSGLGATGGAAGAGDPPEQPSRKRKLSVAGGGQSDEESATSSSRSRSEMTSTGVVVAALRRMPTQVLEIKILELEQSFAKQLEKREMHQKRAIEIRTALLTSGADENTLLALRTELSSIESTLIFINNAMGSVRDDLRLYREALDSGQASVSSSSVSQEEEMDQS